MNNKKLIFTSLLTVIAIVILIVVFRLNESEKEIGYEVAKSEAKVLEIENTKITGISHNTTKNNVSTKIKNKSNKILKNISINYVELDENQNKISTKQVPVEISLKRDEKALIKIIPQNYTYTIDIIGYSYETEDYNVELLDILLTLIYSPSEFFSATFNIIFPKFFCELFLIFTL